MKEFYEKNKKLFWVIVGIICLVICIVVAVGIGTGDKDKNKEAIQPDKSSYSATKEDTEDTEEYEEVTVEEVSMEAVSSEALEIVEDSPLDVVEATQPAVSQQPSPSPGASATPMATPAPGVDVSNMAQNVAFPYEIHVNKQMNCITVYAMDNNGVYSIPLKAMVCSTGAATPLGIYETPAKYVWKVLKGNVWGQYSTRISGAILFHSVPYRTNSKSALISKYYNKLGTTASAGCVRLTTADAKWIYDNCPLGTRVIIYNDSNPGPLGKPTAMKVPESNKWDPTDPDPANPWRGKVLCINGVQSQTMEKGSAVNLMTGVTATDTSGNDVTANIQVTHNANVNKAGVYAVHYSITDALGNTATADSTLTVTDTQAPVFYGVPGLIEGRKSGEITRELLLSGVSVMDNGQPLPLEWVQVQIPTLQDGDNTIVYTVYDESGNGTCMSMTVRCDMKAPVITKNANVSDIMDLTQNLDSNAILNRIQIQDSSATSVTYRTTAQAWGYKIDYTVSDSYGNVSYYTDCVSYQEYQFLGNDTITVSDINNISELRKDIYLKDSRGMVSVLPGEVQIQTTPLTSQRYTVRYTYTYSSPLGSHTATWERIAVIGE